MAAVAIADYEGKGVEIDLWGNLFVVVKTTALNEGTMRDAMAEIDKEAEKLDLNQPVNQVTIFAKRMDVRLDRVGGGKKRPSTIILEKWKEGKLDLIQIDHFWDAVDTAIAGSGRPT